jgi:hypothetical protein
MGEPQVPQKWRLSVRPLAVALSSYFFVSPLVMRKLSVGTTAFTVPPVPEAFWQLTQWHTRSALTGAEMV